MSMITLDHNKLKEEDRRLLLSRSLAETISSHQGAASNTAMTLSLLAILISTFSVVYQTKSVWVISLYAAVSLIGLMIYIKKYKKVQNNLFMERQRLKFNYDALFGHHFAYAAKRVE